MNLDKAAAAEQGAAGSSEADSPVDAKQKEEAAIVDEVKY